MNILPTLETVTELARTGQYTVLPVSCEILSDFTTPIEVLRVLKNISTHCYLLESAKANETFGRYSFLGYDPKLDITCIDEEMKIGSLTVKTEDPSGYLRQILADFRSPRFDYLPSFTGGLVGYFSYDYLGYSEPSVRCAVEDSEAFKDVDLMLFDKVIAFDHLRQKITLIVNMPLRDPETGYRKAVMELHQLADLLRTGEKKNEPCGMLTGDAGCGKTTALKAFAKAHPSVILIEADHGYTAKALFDELCAELGLDERGSLHDKLVRVVNKLNDSGRLVIIDEAEHLPYRALELIRRVHDKAGVGIALCGMPRLEKNVQGDKNHYAQLNSRISAPCRAKLLDNADVKAFIESRFPKYEGNCIERAAQICRRNFRLLSHLVMWSKELMRNNDRETLDNEILESASQMLVVAR